MVSPLFTITVMLFGHPYSIMFKAVERLHSHFLQQVPDCNSFVKVTLAEYHYFHTAVQIFKKAYQLCTG